MDEQDVFKINMIKGWEPIEKYEDYSDGKKTEHALDMTSEPVELQEDGENHDFFGFDDMLVDAGAEWEKMAVDSGAAHNVADGDTWPTVPRVESAGSKKSPLFLGPGKERIPNRGQKSLSVCTVGDSTIRQMTFQDASVRRPLAAVSGITDNGNVILLYKKGSFIAPSNCPEVVTFRDLIHQIKNRIELECKKGVYVMPIWLQTGTSKSSDGQTASFTRECR